VLDPSLPAGLYRIHAEHGHLVQIVRAMKSRATRIIQESPSVDGLFFSILYHHIGTI
jgi:hypothetical protein